MELSQQNVDLEKLRSFRKWIKRQSGLVLFSKFLAFDHDQAEESEDEALLADEPLTAPDEIVIDVDAELGLKAPSVRLPCNSNSSSIPDSASSSSQHMPMQMRRKEPQTLSPHDEGYYEGTVSPMALSEDKLYVSDFQCWIRQNLELFSATSIDLQQPAAGRRAGSVVLGKVGLRCLHCANAMRKCDNPSNFSWPPASVSYPFNMSGLYSACTQKPNLHFSHCPFLPESEKATLKSLTQETTERPAKRTKGGIPNAIYYLISAKRIGLIDVEDGLRFSRDLGFEPLPFETIHTQVEEEKLTETLDEGGPDSAASNSSRRITADAASERILAEAVAEKDDLMFLARSSDKALLSDYMFLTIRQMRICHAIPADFSTRGKKTKLMRVGFAGFCCRHCVTEGKATEFSCRSFCSAADNLSSAISNSFAIHLTKCSNVPGQVKSALAAYRRLHHRQIAQLPYGSQRRLLHELWSRLRNADKSAKEMETLLEMEPKPPEEVPAFLETTSFSAKNSTATPKASVARKVPRETKEDLAAYERPLDFPVSTDPETIAILEQAAGSWDPSQNDFLIIPEDRHLVSDFVFLTMRQLKAALPTAADAMKMRRGSAVTPAFPGLCCLHCDGQLQNISPSGRSFPSAPDNFASALNSSLYKHMQACLFVPADLKRALASVRKIHSAQCSRVKFGSQRRYFNILFARLKAFAPSGNDDAVHTLPSTDSSPDLSSTGFVALPSMENPSSFVCQHCFSVPFQFRAPRSIFNDRPTVAMAKEHQVRCRGQDQLDFAVAIEAFQVAAVELKQSPKALVEMESFVTLIRTLVGGDEGMVSLFTVKLKEVLGLADAERKNCIIDRRLWRHIQGDISVVDLNQGFRKLGADCGCDFKTVARSPRVGGFFMTVCPTFLSLMKALESETDMESKSETTPRS